MKTQWGGTSVNNKPEEYASSTEREARSIALEKAYVHDVYSQIASHFSDTRYRAWPKVKQFLQELEPGSVICDVGCGNGKYLDINPSIYKIGIDRCSSLTGAAREKNHEVLISDNLNIPFRDDCFDAVISIAVIHHFATTERRVAALKELARVLRIGGRLMVSVWAMEQRHRRFESQDVLVPWHRPMNSSSDDKTSSIERDLNSTTTTSDDDAATHYHAYTQTSDSDHSFPSSFPNAGGGGIGASGVGASGRKRGKVRHRGRSIDPTCPSSSQSSSDLSSPNESCYSFVRRALQKLAGTRRNRGGRRPYFLQGLDIPDDEIGDFGSLEEDVMDGLDFRNNLANHHHPYHDFMPIELRQLESTEFAELLHLKAGGASGVDKMCGSSKSKTRAGTLFSNVLYPRRRTLEEPSGDPMGSIAAQPKSKSLSDLFALIPMGILRQRSQKSAEELLLQRKALLHQQRMQNNVPSVEVVEPAHSSSSLSGIFSSNDDLQFPDSVRHKAVQTVSIESLESNPRPPPTSSSRRPSEIFGSLFFTSSTPVSSQHHHMTIPTLTTSTLPEDTTCIVIDDEDEDFIPEEEGGQYDEGGMEKRLRPTLVKQKQSICSPSSGGSGGSDEGGSNHQLHRLAMSIPAEEVKEEEGSLCWGDMKKSVRDLPELRRLSISNTTTTTNTSSNTLQVPPTTTARGPFGSWKQSSLNEELIFSERLKEKQLLKQNIQKQCSLNEDLIYKQRRESNTRWDQVKEAILNSPNVKCLQLIKNGISSRLRGSNGGSDHHGSSDQLHSSASSGSGGGGGGDGQMTPSPTTQYQSSQQQQARQSSMSSSSMMSQPNTSTASSASSSIRNGIVRMLQNWKQGDGSDQTGNGNDNSGFPNSYMSSSNPNQAQSSFQSGASSMMAGLGKRGKDGGQPQRRGLFPPFFLRRSSAGSLNVMKSKDASMAMAAKVLSPPHHLKRRPSENELIHEGVVVTTTNGNKLVPGGVRHIRKLSREEGSDSSKDSSFQSDTSVDSEDSFASVIFIPMNKMDGSGGMGSEGFSFNPDTRANSTDSDRSPKSPAAGGSSMSSSSRLSPPNHNLPKSPSPLASELMCRKRSPEVSPTFVTTTTGSTTTHHYSSVFCTSPQQQYHNLQSSPHQHYPHPQQQQQQQPVKFLFDESATNKLLFPTSNQSTPTGVTVTSSPTAALPEVVPDITSDAVLHPAHEVSSEQMKERESFGTMATTSTSATPSSSSSATLPFIGSSSSNSTSTSGKSGRRKVERIEVLRKPAVLPEGNKVTRHMIRRSLPKALAVELFNPETDDADTSDTSSSSPNSVSSVVSVVNEEGSSSAPEVGNGTRQLGSVLDPSEEVKTEIANTSKNKNTVKTEHGTGEPTPTTSQQQSQANKASGESRKSSSASILEAAANMVSSLETLLAQSSPKTRRKLTLTKLGSTSEWLSSLPPCDNMGGGGSETAPPSLSSSSSSSNHPHSQPPLLKRSSTERNRNNAGEKLLLGDVKKYQQKGPDAKWPSSMTDDSPPQSATGQPQQPQQQRSPTEDKEGSTTGVGSVDPVQAAAELNAKLLEEMEEADSLFDSLENLSCGGRQHPSRNPSIDSSIRMSSTCSCSIRGGESFESWSSAKSSLTNSSSTNNQQPSSYSSSSHKASLPPVLPTQSSFPSTSTSHHYAHPHHPHHTLPSSVSGPSTSSSSRPAGLFSSSSMGGGGPLPPRATRVGFCGGVGGSGGAASRIRYHHQGTTSSSKSSSVAGEDTETSAGENSSTALTYHRYYHVFREGELDKLIEKYVQNLHIISSYYDHANWCIIAEKVQVWTI